MRWIAASPRAKHSACGTVRSAQSLAIAGPSPSASAGAAAAVARTAAAAVMKQKCRKGIGKPYEACVTGEALSRRQARWFNFPFAREGGEVGPPDVASPIRATLPVRARLLQ